MIKSMARKTGRMAVVLPHGVLFRMSKEDEIRRKLLEMDILEAVIGVGQNIFYWQPVSRPASWSSATASPRLTTNKVLFIRRLQGVQKPAAPRTSCCRNTWTTSIAGTRAYQDVDGICRVVTLDEIRENDFNLNIPRYVEPVIEEESMTIDQAIANLKESAAGGVCGRGSVEGAAAPGRVCCESLSVQITHRPLPHQTASRRPLWALVQR